MSTVLLKVRKESFFFSHTLPFKSLRKAFKYADLGLKKHFLLLSTLKTVVLLNIFVEMIFRIL